jgi:hypothetical protein
MGRQTAKGCSKSPQVAANGWWSQPVCCALVRRRDCSANSGKLGPTYPLTHDRFRPAIRGQLISHQLGCARSHPARQFSPPRARSQPVGHPGQLMSPRLGRDRSHSAGQSSPPRVRSHPARQSSPPRDRSQPVGHPGQLMSPRLGRDRSHSAGQSSPPRDRFHYAQQSFPPRARRQDSRRVWQLGYKSS